MLQKLRNVTTSIATTITNTNTSTKSDFKKEINNNSINNRSSDNHNSSSKSSIIKKAIYSDSYMIALIGKPNVGKSTIIRTGLNNLAPITNVGKEESLVYEIDVDDHSYPAQVLEIQENDLPDIDGILVCYDVTSRASIANIAWLLNAFKEFQVPMILVACKADCDESERQVPTQYGVKLGDLFHVGFVELDTRTENGIQKIHDVFSMLLSTSSDAESDQKSSTSRHHRRAASDLSHESRGRKKLSSLSRYVSTKYNNRFNPSKTIERKFLSTDNDGQISSSMKNLSRSLPRSMTFKNTPAISITPPQTPPTTLILPQMSFSPIPNTTSTTTTSSPNTFSSSPNKHFNNPSSNSHRKSILPSSILLQVNEAEEERDEVSIRSGNSRVSCCSYNSTLSSMSGNSENSLLTWETLFIGNESFDKNSNKCSGSRGNGMAIEDLIQRLTIGGQYGTDGGLKTKASNSAKKDSGFGGWIFNGDQEGYLSDMVITDEKSDELLLLSLSSLIQEKEQEQK
ncbi:5072_t:CDS:2, partial [Entrophospora sp. SA101]